MLSCRDTSGGASATEAAPIANMAAGIEVGKLGAATVRPTEVVALGDSLVDVTGGRAAL